MDTIGLDLHKRESQLCIIDADGMKEIAKLDLSENLASELLPLFQVLAPINEQIEALDRCITRLSRDDHEVALLTTAPSIGPITASAVVSTVDDIGRFDSAHQFEAFVGLVPSERSSGEKRRVGSITKAGNSRVRYLLVEAAWRIMRTKNGETLALRSCALLIAARRGKRIAVISPRSYRSKLPTIEYPGHFVVKKITTGGTFRFHYKLFYIDERDYMIRG